MDVDDLGGGVGDEVVELGDGDMGGHVVDVEERGGGTGCRGLVLAARAVEGEVGGEEGGGQGGEGGGGGGAAEGGVGGGEDEGLGVGGESGVRR